MQIGKIILSLFLLNTLQQFTYAQCTSPISSFPYIENFEASDGGWVTGSSTTVASDWEWGTPSPTVKAVITSAASGSKCWIAGGLAKNAYNDGERSWLRSPCFNISSLINPRIAFKVFWETERRYDGAGFQYSTDGGSSWITLGTINSNSTCTGTNWFNYDPINFLAGPGWSGNIQPTTGSCQGGGGSGGWLAASHSLSAIAGASTVQFRFTFAAGTTCNVYDGFAVDDIEVGETPPNSAGFTYLCNGNNSVSFTGTSVGCKTGVVWDFGDIASGINNSSVQDNPVHVFSSPGSYTVKLITSFGNGAPAIVSKDVYVISPTGVITTPINCNGDHNGAISVSVNPAGTYNYLWDTNPAQSAAAINNLGAGDYTVLITGTNTCSQSLTISLTEPQPLGVITRISPAKCGSNNGSVISTVSGGTTPYSYAWSNSGTAASIDHLTPGTYSLQVTDQKGCTASANNLQVNNVIFTVPVSLGKDTGFCPGESVILNPGIFTSYKWQDNSTAPTYRVTATGTYSVTVTDSSGCIGFSSVNITVDCSDIYFPSAFTPNNDRWNNDFGPLGNLAGLRNYHLSVYGRWGELVFSSADPYKKWDGSYKTASPDTQSVVWICTYTLNNLTVNRKGTVLIIR